MTGQNILRLLLVFVPVSFYLGMTHASPTWVFVAACLAILPLAGLMGEATEHLTHHTGPGIGGLLNASFGNAAGAEFAGNVLPFILRGVRLLGTNVNNPIERKKALWARLAGDLKPRHLERIARRIKFANLPGAFDDLIAAKSVGRMVVDFSLG